MKRVLVLLFAVQLNVNIANMGLHTMAVLHTVAEFQALAAGLCLYNEKHCHASAALGMSVTVLSRALLQTL